MKKLTVFLCALWCALLCCGCALRADDDQVFFGEAAAYEAAAFQKQLTECVAEEKMQGQWRFLPDSAVDENELSRCMDWLLHESPEGAYELRKVTYSFREHAEYLEVKVADLPKDSFWVGITACEGINRFYDLKIED